VHSSQLATQPVGIALQHLTELVTPCHGAAIRQCAVSCRMKVSEVLRALQSDGWYLVATRGSHRQFKHASKLGRVTVAGKPSDDLAPGTLSSIRNESGLKL
jgi:predicted RNA binding protein YcfA (HicA-like mRNA interferase family)